jgi:crossover junction endodeoxyribonuclease RuvC
MKEDKLITIGIDPGKDGAMAIIAPNETYVIPFSETDYIKELGYIDTEHYKVFCILEHVGAMPGQGSVSMFNFGANFGFIRGLLSANRIPYELVRPQKWKKAFSCTSDKNTAIEVAKRLFPNIDLRRTPKCKGPHDGICEALLMAEYGRRIYA